MKKELSNLKVGDIFIHKGVLYEIMSKYIWSSYCRYVNDNKPSSKYQRYLYCNFSNYLKVEV